MNEITEAYQAIREAQRHLAWTLSHPGLNEYVNWANDMGVLVNEPSAQEYIESYDLDPEAAQNIIDFVHGPGGKVFGAPENFSFYPHPHLPRFHLPHVELRHRAPA